MNILIAIIQKYFCTGFTTLLIILLIPFLLVFILPILIVGLITTLISKCIKYIFPITLFFCLTSTIFAHPIDYSHQYIPSPPTGGPYYVPQIDHIPTVQQRLRETYNWYPPYNYYTPRYNAPLWGYDYRYYNGIQYYYILH